MPVEFSSREISEKYDRAARWYDWLESVLDILGFGRLRRDLLKRASGKILEVAVGTGKNLPSYPRGSRVIALDLSPEMLNAARSRVLKLPINVSFLIADAEALPFSDKSFDSVVSTLSSCTFPDPVGAFQEMGRVCKSDGRILLLEHGRSSRGWFARFQDRHADQFAKPLGCHWNREPLELVRMTGIRIQQSQRFFFGVFHRIEARPISKVS